MSAEPLRCQSHGGVSVVALDHASENCLGHPLRAALVDALDRAACDSTTRAVVLIGSSAAFSVGADIRELGTSRAEAEPTLRTLIEVVEGHPKPIVAAIGGHCLGAGLELALACHFRLAASDASLGFPEARLGLIPGNGGTQRLPRLVGVERALNLILSGAPVAAERFAGTPLFDAIVSGNLLASAIDLANRVVEQKRSPILARDRALRVRSADAFFQFVRSSIAPSSAAGSAAGKCVDAVEAAVRKPFVDGLAFERKCFDQLAASAEARAMQHVFFAERALGDVPGVSASTPVRQVARVAIVGAGTMGSGIAINFLSAGIPVVLLDATQAALDRGVSAIAQHYDASVPKRRTTASEAHRARALLEPALDDAAARDCDLFIEAVYEDLAVKEGVMRRIDGVAKPGAIFATNTSTLNVDRIASFTRRPDVVVGMHFFSPANVMKLVEIVRGAATSSDVLATVIALAKKIGKTAVISGVCDGFIGNRMFQAYVRQAFFLLEDGALPNEIDAALEAFGMAMGPFRVGDLAGNDIGWAIRKRLRTERPDVPYSGIPDRLCEQGRFGQKTGKGWYLYPTSSREPSIDPDVTRLIEEYRAERGIVPRRVSDDEIVERCVLALVNEGARILEEGVALRASDVDVVYLTGYGFPTVRGGPMFYASTVGLYRVARAMRRFAAEPMAQARGDGRFWEPAPVVARLAADGGRFTAGPPS